MKRKILPPAMMILLVLLLMACNKRDNSSGSKDTPASSNYYVLNVKGSPSPGKTLLNISSFQQTTEYTCGPAAVVSLLRYYGKEGDEMTISGEMGTSTTTGTTPEQMTTWLNNHAFTASWHKEGTLEMLRNNLSDNIPTLVEWSDWGGHWVLVIGYDTRNTEDLMDDVIIFADPYDRHDDNKDGYTWFNAQRFYYMWYDALLFGTVMKRIYISAVPAKIS
jgi:hypothetical protein